MKYYQTIVNFRKSYRKLNYLENGLTVGGLYAWVKTWCEENHIPKDMFGCFHDLALSYVDQDIDTCIICNWLKRKGKPATDF